MADPRVTQDPVEIVKSDPGSTAVSQDPVEVVKSDPGSTVVSQAPVEVITSHAVQINVSQDPVEVVSAVEVPPINMSQMVVEIVGKGLFDDFINVCVIT